MKLNQFGETVRLGILGLGCRGYSQLKVLLDMPDVEITAVSDVYADRVERAQKAVADARGKILFVIREDYKSSNNGRYFGAYLNWTHDKVVFDTTLSGNGVGKAPIRVNDLYNIKNGASDGKTKYAAIDECIAYTYNTDDPTRWCMNYVSCYDTAHCSVSGISLFGAVGDYDYCANKYNRYTADKIDRYDFRGNVGIVLMDFAAASHATMTYGQTYSNMQVYGDDLVRAVICNNNKWNLRRNE